MPRLKTITIHLTHGGTRKQSGLGLLGGPSGPGQAHSWSVVRWKATDGVLFHLHVWWLACLCTM